MMANKFTTGEITKVVDTLVGKTCAIGDSAIDDMRLENLKILIGVVNWCLDGIADSAKDRHAYEYSVQKNGEIAYRALEEWSEWIKAVLNECK